MELAELIHPGMSREETFTVADDNTAIHVGSGAQKVLATPWMIAFMERVSHKLLAAVLPAGYSSVGMQVNVRHLAPTPVGNQVRIRSQVLKVDGRRVTFAIQAWDTSELVGEGEHLRMVLDEARFLRRVADKAAAMPASSPEKQA